jgi:hypothetical protein
MVARAAFRSAVKPMSHSVVLTEAMAVMAATFGSLLTATLRRCSHSETIRTESQATAPMAAARNVTVNEAPIRW